MRIAIASAVLLGLAGAARAEPDDRGFDERYLEAGVTNVMGFAQVGNKSGLVNGLRVRGGPRFGALVLLAEADLASVHVAPPGDTLGPPSEIRGTLARAGAAARFTLAHGHGRDSPEIGGWVSAGLGAHVVAWEGGGVLMRPDLEVGAGWEYVFTGEQHRTFIAVEFGGTLVIGTRAMNEPARCAGPCDRPTAPVLADRYLYIQFLSLEVWR
jgi:hypothetical protein